MLRFLLLALIHCASPVIKKCSGGWKASHQWTKIPLLPSTLGEKTHKLAQIMRHSPNIEPWYVNRACDKPRLTSLLLWVQLGHLTYFLHGSRYMFALFSVMRSMRNITTNMFNATKRPPQPPKGVLHSIFENHLLYIPMQDRRSVKHSYSKKALHFAFSLTSKSNSQPAVHSRNKSIQKLLFLKTKPHEYVWKAAKNQFFDAKDASEFTAHTLQRMQLPCLCVCPIESHKE